MRTAIVLSMVVGTVSLAQAQRARWPFKLVSQQPAIHKNRVLHERTQPLGEKMATTCGKLEVALAPIAKLHVAADGSISKVELVQSKLSAQQSACIREVFSTLTYPARRKPSIVTWVVAYGK